jgi:lipid-binding SYLF domain-containing protein
MSRVRFPFAKQRVLVLGCVAALGAASLAAAKSGVEKRLDAAAAVLSETLDSVDQGIPASLLDRAHCVGVFPSVWKGALLIGGRFGKGVVTCRVAESSQNSSWSAPVNFRIEGGNIGFQVGGNQTDLVLLFLGERAIPKLLRTGFTIGLDGAAAAGPVGRTAAGQTDALLGVEIVTYSRSRGLFAGVSVDGATLRPAHKANRVLYEGWSPYPKEILEGRHPATPAAQPLLDVLNKHSPERRRSD